MLFHYESWLMCQQKHAILENTGYSIEMWPITWWDILEQGLPDCVLQWPHVFRCWKIFISKVGFMYFAFYSVETKENACLVNYFNPFHAKDQTKSWFTNSLIAWKTKQHKGVGVSPGATADDSH